MRMMLTVHILAGGLSLVLGTVALSVTKGSPLHRRSGRLFVHAMVALTLTGGGMAVARAEEISAIASLLTLYLVVTALTTMRRPAERARALDLGAMLFALALGLASLGYGLAMVASGVMVEDDIPTPILFEFGAVALLAGVGDIRMIRAGVLRGVRRPTRHLWRMCFALYVSVASFFLGQAQVFPEALREPALLALPVLAVVITLLYWLWRVRIRGNLQGLVGIEPDEAVQQR
jgi:uncharacterized membrane protein